ncbi:MAG: hypothetical protein GWP91_23820 [Rhodobacterales bacterium]|nr:hypothetical protein [Rhodobacterales bacterium]
MSEIQTRLVALGESRITPAVLNALDFVVPGEWENVTSLEEAIESYLDITDPVEVAKIKARAEELYASQPHYARALKLYAAADSVDKVAAAAVLAKQAGKAFDLLSILDRFTPKAETTQAIDAALKLAVELAAFACLRGIPLTSLADAKAFPATLATYARADMMRLAAWITLDGVIPLGPEFVSKVHATISETDTSILTNNALFKQLAGVLPGGDPEGQKGFILSSLDSANGYVTEFVSAQGITQASLAGTMGTLFNVADTSMDVLGATLDASTDYFAHTGVQSVARVLVHDAEESLAATVPPPLPVAQADAPVVVPEEEAGVSPWFKAAAVIGGGAAVVGAGIAVGNMLFRGNADDEDEDEDELDDADLGVDAELDGLDDNQLEAREAGLRMRARRAMDNGASEEELDALRQERRRMRRARRRRGRGRGGLRGGGRRGGGGGRRGGGRRGGGGGRRGGGGGRGGGRRGGRRG